MKIFRQNELINILQRDRLINTKEMSEYFGVSIETIRRDLDQLEKQGMIRKTYGGAELSPQTDIMPSPLVTRRSSLQATKAAIAARAAELIPDNCTIALDAGSTIFELCPYLNQRSNLIIVCSDVHTASKLLECQNNKVYIMGGFLTPDGTSSGTFVKEFFNNISRIDIFLCATDGASPIEGLSSDESGINKLKQRYMKSAQKTIALIDHSKFNHNGFYKTCDFNELDMLITDSKTPDDILLKIKQTNIPVEIAEDGSVE